MNTYKTLFTQVNELIGKNANFNTTQKYEKQLSHVSVQPLSGNPLSDASSAELITTINTLLKDAIAPWIASGLVVDATDPITNQITISAGTGSVGARKFTLASNTTITIPFDSVTTLFYVNLYQDRVMLDKAPSIEKIQLAQIIVPKPGTTNKVRDIQSFDEPYDAYLQNANEFKFYGDGNGNLSDDSTDIIERAIFPISADNIVGGLKLNEDVKITNTSGSIEIDSLGINLYDVDSNVMAKFNRRGTFFYNTDGVEMARFTTDDARIGNILITKNSVESADFVTGSAGFQIQDDGSAEFNDVIVRGTIYASAGKIANWTIETNQLSSGNMTINSITGIDFNSVFTVDQDGAIGATSGSIGGWSLLSDRFYGGSGSSYIGLIPGTGIQLGNEIFGSAPFRVTNAGAVTAISGAIGGWTLASDRLSYGTDDDYIGLIPGVGIQLGDSVFADAEFSVTNAGVLKAVSGTVGAWTLDTDRLYGGSGSAYIGLIPGTGLYLGSEAFGSAPFSVTSAGVLKAVSGLIGNWTISTDRLSGGTGSSYIGLLPGTGMYLGAEALGSAPFSVTNAGYLSSISGRIGGWYIDATTLASDSDTDSANILVDQANGLLRVGSNVSGSASYITIDGANKRMESSDFVSGVLGSGWRIDTDIAEFQNIRARGKITTAVFEKDAVSTVGGSLMTLDSDILDTDMTALDSSTLTILGDTTFDVGDILFINDGTDEEWLEVTNTTSGSDTYTVTRDKKGSYATDSNPIWKKGTAVANYGVSGEGGVLITASETNSPYVDVFTHDGSPWDGVTVKCRLGNLAGINPYYGYGLYAANNFIIGDITSENYIAYVDGVMSIQGDLILGGGSLPPDDVSYFTVEQDEDFLVFTWTPVLNVDLKGYEIRLGEEWNKAFPIDTVIAGSGYMFRFFGLGLLKFHIKAIDFAGNYSDNATSVSIIITRRPGKNAAYINYEWGKMDTPLEGFMTENMQKFWSTLYDSSYNRIALMAKSTNRWDTWDMDWTTAEEGEYEWDFPIGEGGGTTWIYDIKPIDFGGLIKVSHLVQLEYFRYQQYSTDDYSAIAQDRQSADGITWGDWKLYNPGFITARYWDFRFVIVEAVGNLGYNGDSFFNSVSLFDVPDVVDSSQAVDIADSGTAVAFTRGFITTPKLFITPYKANTPLCIVMDKADISNTGFTLKLRDPEAAAYVAGEIDWKAEGY